MSTLSSSFRDPAGYLFTEGGQLYRQVNPPGIDDYRALMDSGLYTALVDSRHLIGHEEVDHPRGERDAACVLKPEMLPYISYPYEWSFQQLKDAALLTLDIQLAALAKDLSLKDASAFNVQFVGSRPVFIDTLSFERYREGTPWVAYRQFCQHFLAPLALAAHCDLRLRKLFLGYIDGIPLDLASRLLPRKSWLKYSLLSHIHLHAKAQSHYSNKGGEKKPGSGQLSRPLSKKQQVALLGSLRSAVESQQLQRQATEWGDYYEHTNYSDAAAEHKASLVDDFLKAVPAPIELAQDLGANNGRFSRIAAQHARWVVSQDIDPNAVQFNYNSLKAEGPANILPLELDLTAPTPAIGWANRERDSFMERPKADVVLALALVHHMAISNNIPLANFAAFLAQRCRWLIIEFVPKQDSQVEILLATRTDIFPDYTLEGFEEAFSTLFHTRQKQHIEASSRTLYLMERR